MSLDFRGFLLRIGMAIAAASMFLVSAVSAADRKDLIRDMPRAYFGEFRWDDDRSVQNVVIILDSVRAVKGLTAEALGCGTYEIGRDVTKIKVRMLVRASDLQVEIFELAPEGNTDFVTDGSHRGTLSADLQQIDAMWTTRSNGRQGRLQLRAASFASCAPAAAA